MSSLSLFGIPIPLHNGWALLFNVGSSLEFLKMSICKLFVSGLLCIPIEIPSFLFYLLCICFENGNGIENF